MNMLKSDTTPEKSQVKFNEFSMIFHVWFIMYKPPSYLCRANEKSKFYELSFRTAIHNDYVI